MAWKEEGGVKVAVQSPHQSSSSGEDPGENKHRAVYLLVHTSVLQWLSTIGLISTLDVLKIYKY